MSIMDQVKLHLREWYSLATDRTGEMAKISVRMYDKYGISREIERQLSELGSYVYHEQAQGRVDFADDATFQAAIERIQALEHDLTAKIEEIELIRQQRQQKAAAQAEADGEPEEAGAEESDIKRIGTLEPAAPAADEAEVEDEEEVGDTSAERQEEPDPALDDDPTDQQPKP
jgi:hypothetical protein